MTTPQAIPRGRGTAIAALPRPAATPNGAEPLDPTTPAFQKKLEEEWLVGVEALLKNFSSEKFPRLLSKLFSEADLQVSTRFSKTEISLPDSWFNLSLAEGATLCLGLQNKSGNISIPQPIALGGFSASAWIFGQPLDKVVTDEAGKVGVSSPCFDKALKDITPEVMASPLGGLFSDGKVAPVSLEALLRLAEKSLQAEAAPQAPASSPMQGMIEHLDRMALSALIYQEPQDRPASAGYLFSWDGGICHASAASVHADFQIPLLKENIQKQLYWEFDFQGLEELAVHWPRFPVQKLFPEEQLKVQSGNVSLDLIKKGDSLEATLRFREVKWVLNSLFGEEPVQLNGELRMVLAKGGNITLEPVDLQIRLPVFPSQRAPLFSFSGTLKGPLLLHREGDGSIHLQKSELGFKDFTLTARDENPLTLAGLGKLISGRIHGLLNLNYNAWHPEQNFTPTLDVQGDLAFAPQDGRHIDKIVLRELRAKGGLSFLHRGDNLEPNLSASKLEVSTQLSLEQGGKELLNAEGLRLNLRGGERKEQDGKIQQSSTVILGADGVYARTFAWVPEIALQVETRKDASGLVWAGAGDFHLASIEPKEKLAGDRTIIPPFTDIGLPFSFSTEGGGLDWQVEVRRPQIVGPVTLEGGLLAAGGLDRFQITTTAPLAIRIDGKKVVTGLTVKGSHDEKKTAFSLQAASLGGLVRGGIWFRPAGTRIVGSYQFSPLAKVLRQGDLPLKQAQVQGSFSTPDLEKMLEKPRVFLNGKGGVRLEGETSGEVKLNYKATLLYQPATQHPTRRGPREFPPNIQLVFSRGPDSQIEFGPFTSRDGKEVFKGHAGVKGSLIVTPRDGNYSIGGSGIGMTEGVAFFGGGKNPVLSGWTVDAEQLWGIRRGTAHGRSLRFEADVDLTPLLGERAEGADAQALRRHILYIVDRQPLTAEAFWRLLRSDLPPAGEGPRP